jgi:hypothetical protein
MREVEMLARKAESIMVIIAMMSILLRRMRGKMLRQNVKSPDLKTRQTLTEVIRYEKARAAANATIYERNEERTNLIGLGNCKCA